ncbi:MAG: DoxX family membrane protein [Bacteroidota bacterium]
MKEDSEMESVADWISRTDVSLTRWMAHHGVRALRVSLGLVFFWFGVLKFFPGLSPAQDLATRTIDVLTFGMIPSTVSIPILATWECVIGLGLITGWFVRATLFLLFAQMVGTVTPLFLFPHETFTQFPYAPTLEGQYIIKNIVLATAAIVIGATVRGGYLTADPGTHDVLKGRGHGI